MRWLSALVFLIVLSLGSLAVVSATRQRPASVAQSNQLWHCGMHPQVIQDHPGDCPICHMALTPVGAPDPMGGPAGTDAGPVVRIDPVVAQNMGVRTAVVTRGALHKTVHTVGLLKLPEPGMHDVTLKIGGWVERLYADQEGMHVEEGQPLFDLYSPDLQVTEQELISAIHAERQMGDNADPSARRNAKSLVESARRRLRLWDIADQDIDAIARAEDPPRTVPIRSPATGHVEEKMIVQGSAVQPMTKVLRVADHGTLWLEAQVYADQFPLVRVGQEVRATVDAAPGKTWSGKISFVMPHFEAMARTITVRATLENPGLELKPGMYASVDIATQPADEATLAPREAVIDTGTRRIAFVADGSGHFTPREVRTGLAGDGDVVQVLAGLSPGETVVTSGQFLMDVESRTIEATQKLTAVSATGSVRGEGEPPASAMSIDSRGRQPAVAQSVEQHPVVDARSPSVPATTRPTSLAVAYCSMAKARWVQAGDALANPYMGSRMLTCGTVERQVVMPAEEPWAGVVQAYLAVASRLDADRVDVDAVGKLKASVEKLPDDDRAARLREATGRLAATGDLKETRAAFRAVSDEILGQLTTEAK